MVHQAQQHAHAEAGDSQICSDLVRAFRFIFPIPDCHYISHYHSALSIMHSAAASAIYQQEKQVARHVAQHNHTRKTIIAILYNGALYLNLLPSIPARKHSDTLQALISQAHRGRLCSSDDSTGLCM